MANTIVVLQPSQIEKYLSVFHPRTRPSDDDGTDGLASLANSLPSSIPSNLRIDFGLRTVLDITPLARINSRVPEMEIEVIHATLDDSTVNEAVSFINAVADSSCLIDFERTVNRILLRWSLQPELVVKLHSGVMFKDLAKIRASPFSEFMYDWSADEWLRIQEMPRPEKFKAVMEGSEGVLRDIPLIYRNRRRPPHPFNRIRSRVTAGRSSIFKRTQSMDALLNGILPPTSALAGVENLSISVSPSRRDQDQ